MRPILGRKNKVILIFLGRKNKGIGGKGSQPGMRRTQKYVPHRQHAITPVACLDVGRDDEFGAKEGSQGSVLGNWIAGAVNIIKNI